MAIRFDLSSIPAGATVSSASLQLYTYEQQGPLDHTVGVYKAARAWDENANWTKATATANWSRSGGDFSTNQCRTFVQGNRINVWESYSVRNAVQEYVNNPAANYGLLVKIEQGTDGHGYYASEWSNQSLRPKLVVTYEVATAVAGGRAGTTGPWAVAGGGSAASPAHATGERLDMFALDGSIVRVSGTGCVANRFLVPSAASGLYAVRGRAGARQDHGTGLSVR